MMQPTRWSSAFEILQRRLRRREEEQRAVQELRGEGPITSVEAEREAELRPLRAPLESADDVRVVS